jgi:hypothetical protein
MRGNRFALRVLLVAAAGALWSATAWPMTSVGARTTQHPGQTAEGLSPLRTARQLHDGHGIPVRASWSIQPLANPSAAGEFTLESISCPSASFCVAVLDGNGSAIEQWDGYAWSTMRTPRMSSGSGLYGVSCASSWSCVAVGSRLTTNGAVPLIERWSGRSWAVQRAPSAPKFDRLSSVACTTSTCQAVGLTQSGNLGGREGQLAFPVAIGWIAGHGWRLEPVQRTSRFPYGDLNGVACVSSTWCMAVGAKEASAVGYATALVEHWNGTRWILAGTPSPRHAHSDTGLVGVSCNTTRSCVSVGSWSTFGHPLPSNALAAYWNGSGWSVLATPNRSWADRSALDGVSCISAAACVAVGYSSNTPFDTNFHGTTLVEVMTGKSWSIDPSPNAGGRTNDLTAVSCTSRSLCESGGVYDTYQRTGLGSPYSWRPFAIGFG